MKSELCIITCVITAVVSPLSTAQELSPLTLTEAVRIARAHNLELLASRQELEIARGRLLRAQYPNQFNPEIATEVIDRSRGEPGERGNVTDFSVSLSQQFEIAGQREKRIDEAERQIFIAAQRAQDRERIVLAQVKDRFYRAHALNRRKDLLRQVEDLTRRLHTAAKLRFQAGEITKLEVNLAEIQLGQARRDTLIANRDYLNGVHELRHLLGKEFPAPLVLAEQLTVQPQIVDEQAVLHQALERRPDLQAARAEVGRIEAETELTRRLAFPNPTLSFLYREEERRDYLAGAAIRIPLPVFDRKQAELHQLASRKEQATYERQNVERLVHQEVQEALRTYNTAKAEVEVYEQDVLERAAENFQLIEVAYREGQINLLQLVVVQTNLVTAQLSYIDALNTYWQARVALERAIGADL